MALTEPPAAWKFLLPLPEQKDTRSRLTRLWTLDVAEPVSRGSRNFPLTKPLTVTAQSQRTLEGAEVLLKIDTEVATECRRCCAPLTVAIHEEFMYSYKLQAGEAEKVQEQEEEEFCSSDRVCIPVARLGTAIDVTGLVWECLVVSLPVYAACPQGCAEMPSLPTTEDQTDPRFQALADFLEDDTSKGGKEHGNPEDENIPPQNS